MGRGTINQEDITVAIGADVTGICPHCGTAVRFERMRVFGDGNYGEHTGLRLSTKVGYNLYVLMCSCPACGKPVLAAEYLGDPNGVNEPLDTVLFPDSTERFVPNEVRKEDPDIASDFVEASAVFGKSRKASAALARRCLQGILTRKGGATKKDLSGQIDEVMLKLPSQLASNVDAIRQVGNFAAHPMKSTATGNIVDVEDGEAEWLLDVLEELFDFFYVAPAAAANKRAGLNKKLAEIGKPPLKGLSP